MTLYGIREEQPGPRWQTLHDVTRDAYHRWYLSEGADARPDLRTCRRMLVSYMPELVPVWERLVEPSVATRSPPGCLRCGTLHASARLFTGHTRCSCRGRRRQPRSLARPKLRLRPGPLRESGLLKRLHRADVSLAWEIACGALLDGMNDAGLAVSLAFRRGGPGSSPGFGIPLVVRYLLRGLLPLTTYVQCFAAYRSI